MRQTTRRTVEREVEVAEEYCDATGEKLLVTEDGKPVEVVLPHVRLHLELVGQRDDGSPFTWRIPREAAPRITIGQILKILTPSQLGALFASFSFVGTGAGSIQRRKTPKGDSRGPEVGG